MTSSWLYNVTSVFSYLEVSRRCSVYYKKVKNDVGFVGKTTSNEGRFVFYDSNLSYFCRRYGL